MSRTPFDAFEVALVGEYTDHHDGTFMEQIISNSHLAEVRESGDLIRLVYTVYGHRSWPDQPVTVAEEEEYGVTAISDFDQDHREAAIDLAYALADGKPVTDWSFDVPAPTP